MEGPTPVSALIHAATMVTAGLYLLIRCSFLLVLTPNIFYFITVLGTCTIIFSSLTAIYQFDLKKIIAYSTCSQLGYMFLSIGLTNFTLSYYHLVTHAFFKALLFLSAGSIIHLFHGEQDIRKLGGLSNFAPFLYIVFLIGNISLFGFFFTSGFYSKESLLSFVNSTAEFGYLQYCGYFSLLMTAFTIFYSIRLFYYSFFNFSFNGFYAIYTRLSFPVKFSYEFYVLFFLAFCSIIVGFILQDFFFENSLFFSSSIAHSHASIIVIDFSSSFLFKLIPFFFFVCVGLGYGVNANFFQKFFNSDNFLGRFFSSKFFFDSIISYLAFLSIL
jgi:NADH:ubiquinone oxidoreductase subunit 5 (subunit L)/multisubunit Na+/H+ antiporter MnhA subunit